MKAHQILGLALALNLICSTGAAASTIDVNVNIGDSISIQQRVSDKNGGYTVITGDFGVTEDLAVAVEYERYSENAARDQLGMGLRYQVYDNVSWGVHYIYFMDSITRELRAPAWGMDLNARQALTDKLALAGQYAYEVDHDLKQTTLLSQLEYQVFYNLIVNGGVEHTKVSRNGKEAENRTRGVIGLDYYLNDGYTLRVDYKVDLDNRENDDLYIKLDLKF